MGLEPENRRPAEPCDFERATLLDAGALDRAASGCSAQVRRGCGALIVCLLLILAVALTFGGTVRYDFVNFDDDILVYENPTVARGVTVHGIVWAFTTSVAHMWYPLTWISYMLDSQMYGTKPWGYHLTNVILHGATSVILFLALRRATGTLWASAFVAMLFAVHPLRAEAVAWVGERKSPLSGLFFVSTIAAYVKFAQRPSSLVRYLAVAGLFTLGLLAKPTLVTLPFLLLLLDYWPLRRFGTWRGARLGRAGETEKSLGDAVPREAVQSNVPSSQGLDPVRNPPFFQQFTSSTLPSAGTGHSNVESVGWLVIEKIPLLLLSIACSVAAVLSQAGNIAPLKSMAFTARIANATVSYAVYLGQLFWPFGLAAYYHYEENLLLWQAGVALLVLTAISVAAVLLWRRQPAVLIGWLWYLGTLLPTSGLVQIGTHARADRYTYLPHIGLCIALVWGTQWTVEQLCREAPSRRWLYGVGGMLLGVGLMVCTWQQNLVWQNSERLWSHALSCTSNNNVAHNNLGILLADRGEVDKAIWHYEQALKIEPNDPDAHNNLGLLLADRGGVAEAITHYLKALQVRPDFALAHSNLGIALARRGQVEDAIGHFRRAVEIKPDLALAHYNLGIALADRGQVDEATTHLQKALAIEPDHVGAHFYLGTTLARSGRVDEAIAHYRRVLEIRPDFVAAHINLGVALAARGQVDEAAAHYRNVLEIEPDYVEAHNNLGLILAARGQLNEAIAHFRKALKTQPDYLEAHFNLGILLAGLRRIDEADQHYRKALALATARGDWALAGAIRARIRRYQPEAVLPEK